MIKEFKRASTVEEAVRLSEDGYVILAGGTQVNNTLYRKWGKDIEKVVSIDDLKLEGIRNEQNKLIIGSMTTLQDLADSEIIPEALVMAAQFIPTRSIRNIATIGGNIGAGRRDSYIIPALIALEGEVLLAGGKKVKVEDYLAKKSDYLITEIHLPVIKGITRAIKESRSHLALPVVSAAVSISSEKGKITRIIIAAGCINKGCVRLSEVEKAVLDGKLTNDTELEDAIARNISPESDILGSSTYKTYINSVRIADCVRYCMKEVLK